MTHPRTSRIALALIAAGLWLSACSDDASEGDTLNETGFDDPYATYLDQSWDACGAPGQEGDRDVVNLDQLTGTTRGRVIRSWQGIVSIMTVPNPVTCEPMNQTASLVTADDAGAIDSAAFTLDSIDLRYDLYFYDPDALADSDIDSIAEDIAVQIGQSSPDQRVTTATMLDAIVIAKIHPTDSDDTRDNVVNAYGQANSTFG